MGLKMDNTKTFQRLSSLGYPSRQAPWGTVTVETSYYSGANLSLFFTEEDNL